jgi:hypothetical protein
MNLKKTCFPHNLKLGFFAEDKMKQTRIQQFLIGQLSFALAFSFRKGINTLCLSGP